MYCDPTQWCKLCLGSESSKDPNNSNPKRIQFRLTCHLCRGSKRAFPTLRNPSMYVFVHQCFLQTRVYIWTQHTTLKMYQRQKCTAAQEYKPFSTITLVCAWGSFLTPIFPFIELGPQCVHTHTTPSLMVKLGLYVAEIQICTTCLCSSTALCW